MTDDLAGWKAWSDYVSEDLKAEQARKQAFESRGFALITANAAFATLLITTSVALGYAATLRQLPMSVLVGASALGLAFSVGSAVLVTYPRQQKGLPSSDHKKAVGYLRAGVDADAVYEGIINTRVSQLESWRVTNEARAKWTLRSIWALALWPLAMLFAIFLATPQAAPLSQLPTPAPVGGASASQQSHGQSTNGSTTVIPTAPRTQSSPRSTP